MPPGCGDDAVRPTRPVSASQTTTLHDCVDESIPATRGGGTSLFGGKGRAVDAVIGGVVVATIANGLGLLNQSSYINFLVTGGVLLLAASVDAISRRRRSSTGLG